MRFDCWGSLIIGTVYSIAWRVAVLLAFYYWFAS